MKNVKGKISWALYHASFFVEAIPDDIKSIKWSRKHDAVLPLHLTIVPRVLIDVYNNHWRSKHGIYK